MSYCTPNGLRAEPPRTVHQQQSVLVEIQRDWTGDDPARLRGLAALTLQSDGWTLEMIRSALRWRSKSAAANAIRRTRQALREHFGHLHPGADVDKTASAIRMRDEGLGISP